jgi:hypothetical protein
LKSDGWEAAAASRDANAQAGNARHAPSPSNRGACANPKKIVDVADGHKRSNNGLKKISDSAGTANPLADLF